jgi:hypothetical protein
MAMMREYEEAEDGDDAGRRVGELAMVREDE